MDAPIKDDNKTEDISKGASAPATRSKTPMFEAMHADRYLRQTLIRELQKATSNTLLCYIAGLGTTISRDDTLGIVDLIHNTPANGNIDFMLHTAGGDIDAAEKLISIVRTAVGSGRLRVVVPDFAKSAGTLMAIAADAIVMSDSSELGPIDPQITLADGRGNAIPHSVSSYLDAYEEHSSRLRANPNDVVSQIMLAKLEPATVNLFSAAKLRARRLAEDHLKKWMLHESSASYTAVAGELMNTAKWLTHGQMIGYQAAQSINLEVIYLPPSDTTWQAFWRLYCLQRLAIRDNQKLFESEFVSLPIDTGATH